ncbi:MAG: alanine--glyoxylate aminotransferase family protein [Sedimentisphaerales bacterium]|nr:alanine--glyoxylate aminotransferase family protein [Sedimentisphaerales bacterium]
MVQEYIFKQATEPWEFEQIHRLNYETFVEEIPQHQGNQDRRLVDLFHEQNTYFICLHNRELLGMLALRDQRPFSLDRKLENLDSYLPEAKSICEIRLLAFRKAVRHRELLRRLLYEAGQYMLTKGYDMAIISGLLEQQKLYRHLGFVPFGPIVGHDGAQFQPMYLTAEQYAQVRRPIVDVKARPGQAKPILLMPGPVEVSSTVRDVFFRSTLSHRWPEFIALHRQTRQRLCNLTGAHNVGIFMGSGTLANDAVAGQLSLLSERGLILTNGEFGERLLDHGHRFGLSFETVQLEWGQPFNLVEVERILENQPNIGWVWAVHCETSTGMINDLAGLKQICLKRKVRLCMDCVSSIGTIPVDLQDVYLASGVSGKGLCCYSGLSIVFCSAQWMPRDSRLPACLDVSNYVVSDGVPFTICSNLVAALHQALQELDFDARMQRICHYSRQLRNAMADIGLPPLVEESLCNPAVLTLCLNPSMDSGRIGEHLKRSGFLVSYGSKYLRRRNWIQICLMGSISEKNLQDIIVAFKALIRDGIPA